MSVLHNALEDCIVFERFTVRLEGLVGIVEVELAVLCRDSFSARDRGGDLSVHLAVDPVHPRHRMARAAYVDSSVLVGVGDAGEGELVVDSAGVVAESFHQGQCHWSAAKRVALPCEQGLQLRRKRIAHRRQPDGVVVAASVEAHWPVLALFSVGLSPLLEPVCCTASLAVLALLIYGTEVV